VIPTLTLAGAIHTVLAMLGIVLGLIQFVRSKRGRAQT